MPLYDIRKSFSDDIELNWSNLDFKVKIKIIIISYAPFPPSPSIPSTIKIKEGVTDFIPCEQRPFDLPS